MSRVLRLMAGMFALIGLLFALTAGGVAAYLHTASAGMVPVDGRIVGFSGTGPLVAYTLSGETFQISASTHSATMQVGSTYQLLADPADPARYVDAGLWVLVLVFGVIGGAMLLTALILRMVGRHGEQKRSELLLCGQRVRATVTEVRVDRSISLGSRHPVRLLASCTNPITNEAMTVRSHLVWPQSYAPGQAVEVLFDPLDPAKYAFDLPEENA